MNVPYFLKSVVKFTVKNSPVILTGLGVLMGWTAVGFAIDATPKAKAIEEDLKEEYLQKYVDDEVDTKDVPPLEMIKAVGPVYIPTGIALLIMTGCMVGATSIGSKRNVVLASLYSASEVALKEYQSKVIEKIGEKKEIEVRDSIAKDRMDRNPISQNQIILTGNGNHLCMDSMTGQYFRTDIEKVRRTQNDVNHRLMSEMWISLNELLIDLGIEPTALGHDIGWDVDHQLEFFFSSQINKNGEPCLVLEYLTPPTGRKW